MDHRWSLQRTPGEAGRAVVGTASHNRRSSDTPRRHSALASQETPVFLAGTGRAHPAEIRSAVRAAATAATDFSWLSRGDPVLIKPVLNSGNRFPYTTSPAALGGMIELLKEKGAGRVIVGDMSGIEHVRPFGDRPSGSTHHLMHASGMAAAVLAAGGELYAFEDGGWDGFCKEHPLSGSNWSQGLMMPKILQEVEHIVLMPRCGRHLLTGASLGLKAAVGYWRTDTRLEYHRDAATLHEKTAEGNTVPTLLNKQRLVLTAADKVLTTFGPDDGRVCQPVIGMVIASQSVVAHDMISLAWLLETRQAMPPPPWKLFIDRSRLAARIGNRVVVAWLSNLKTALDSETFTKNALRCIGDDRVLNHAYRVLGGRPKIALQVANDLVPRDLHERLSEMSTNP